MFMLPSLQLMRWQEKCSNESETVNWILANTKKCPKCLARIEKNQGCNHMVCKNKGCKKEFCWVCMDDWYGAGCRVRYCWCRVAKLRE